MKDKRTYSLTAKERKERRYAEQNKSKSKVEPNERAAEARKTEEQTMIAAQSKSRRTSVIIGAVVAVAIILIIVALIAPVIAYMINPYRDYKHVIARFELSNEMVLEYVIEEDEYDIAATNFIFLAKNGYFDNTVLFDAGDASREMDGWVRFGGYEKQPYTWVSGASGDYDKSHHHASNKKYCESFTALPNKKFADARNKFGYKLYADKNGESADRLDDIGVLTYLYDDTSTEFQMSYKERPSNDVRVRGSGNNGTYTTKELKSTMVGYALNNDTVKNLQKIAAKAKENTSISSGVIWYPPQPTIYIRKVKVYNLDGKKWDDFDFLEYLNGQKDGGGTRYKDWPGRVYGD